MYVSNTQVTTQIKMQFSNNLKMKIKQHLTFHFQRLNLLYTGQYLNVISEIAPPVHGSSDVKMKMQTVCDP